MAKTVNNCDTRLRDPAEILVVILKRCRSTTLETYCLFSDRADRSSSP